MSYQTIEADITKMEVDCIVNAANNSMLGGGGVDGAIHRAAGGKLFECCKDFPIVDRNDLDVRLPTGDVRITPAFKLPSKFIIHTAGPVWYDGTKNEAELLTKCYRNSMWLAALHGKSVAIPAISTGIYSYPIPQACEIAAREVKNFQNYHPEIKIFLVTYMSQEVSECFEKMGIKNVSCDRVETQ